MSALPPTGSAAAAPPRHLLSWYSRTPLYLRVLVAVAIGTVLGLTLDKQATAPLGDIGMLVIKLLKALATPLIFVAVIDAFLRVRIAGSKALKLIGISVANAAVAILIGISVASLFHAGDHWREQRDAEQRAAQAAKPTEGKDAVSKPTPGAPATPALKPPEGATLDPLKNIASYVPANLIDPFRDNNVISVVLIAILIGAALRALKDREDPATAPGLAALEAGIGALFQALAVVLGWIVQVIPLAVLVVIANLVGKTGGEVFKVLGLFLATVLIGLFLQSVVYYSLVLWTVGRTSPLAFFRNSSEAIITALSCGSSLATMPVTLRCLNDRLKVSLDSARIAACVGTNLNHAGIILYEAAAALFVAQALGYDLSLGQQVTIALASMMAGIGIAGVPDAGLITLPLVLAAAGMPADVVATVPLMLFPVDWIVGRCRAATNVISDMMVAVLLDRWTPGAQPAPAESPAT